MARTDQGRGRARERRARAARRGEGGAHRRRRRCNRRGRARRPVSDRRLPDRLRHELEHERERGDRRARRRRRAPERRREHGAELERRLPVGRPPGGARRAAARPPPRARRARRRARGEGARVRGRGQVRPHAPDGCRPGHARPGVRGLCGPGAGGNRPPRGRPRAARADRARRHRRRHGAQHASRVRRARPRAARRRHRPRDLGSGRPVRGAGRPRRSRRGVRRAEDGRGLADEDRERPAPDGLRSASRPRRDLPARAAEGQLDHAGQGQPGHSRGRDAGRRPGDRQRHGDHRRRAAGAFRAERLRAPDGPQPARLDQAARLGEPPARREVRLGDRGQSRAVRALRRADPRSRDGAQSLHRLRQGGRDREDRRRVGPLAARGRARGRCGRGDARRRPRLPGDGQAARTRPSRLVAAAACVPRRRRYSARVAGTVVEGSGGCGTMSRQRGEETA